MKVPAIAFRVPSRHLSSPFMEAFLAILSSSVDTGNPEYRANAERMHSLVRELQARRAEAAPLVAPPALGLRAG